MKLPSAHLEQTQVAQVDWRRLSQQLAGIEGQLQSLGQEHSGTLAEAESIEAQLLETDNHLGCALAEDIRRVEAEGAANRERIATAEATIEHERNRSGDLEQEIARCRRQLAAMSARAGDLQQQLRDTADSLGSAEENHRDVARRLAEAERTVTDLMASLDRLRSENEQSRAAHLEQTRRAAALDSEIGILESQAAAAAAVCERSSQRTAELDAALGALQRQLEELRRQRTELTDRDSTAGPLARRRQGAACRAPWAPCGRAKGTVRVARASERRRRTVRRSRRARPPLRRSRLGREGGIATGGRKRGQAPDGRDPMSNVVGLLADLFQVSVEAAPLVEIALGQAANTSSPRRRPNCSNCSKASPAGSAAASASSGSTKKGDCPDFRVNENGTAPVSPRLNRPTAEDVDLQGRPGVLGRADRFVQVDARFAPLAKRLLGQTWFVDKLANALGLARSAPAGLTFVTLAGEMLQPDGTLIVGPRNVAIGLISQRSQLRALRAQLDQLAASIEAADGAAGRFDAQIEEQQEAVDRHSAEHQQAADALAENRVAVTTVEERRSQLDQQRAACERELRDARQQHDAALARLADCRQCAQAARCRDGRNGSDRSAFVPTNCRVGGSAVGDAARNDRHQSRIGQERRAVAEPSCPLPPVRGEPAGTRSGDRGSRTSVSLKASSGPRLPAAPFCKPRRKSPISTCGKRPWPPSPLIGSISANRCGNGATPWRRRPSKSAPALRKIEEEIHAADLAANEVRHQRTTLADRLREDYGIELADLDRTFTPEEQHQREAVQHEIEELRQKINNLGNVNLEALDELEQLESRHKAQTDQHRDLTSAKASLEKIIEKINADSRRLFAETLESVKEHFQTLFRDLFGGGRADIVLEEGVDILDSGIEIVARPPGKEPRSISLLERRREDADLRGAAVGDLSQPPQPLLRARRSRCRPGRGQHRPLHARS